MSAKASGAMSVAWVTHKINQTLDINQVSASTTVVDSLPRTSQTIKLGGGLGVTCQMPPAYSRQSCDFGTCSRQPEQCDYSCTKCVSYWVGSACFSDPVCEAGKFICNAGVEASIAACNVAAAAKTAACNASEEAKVAASNVARTAATAACSVAEAIANEVTKQSDIGEINVGATIRVSATVANPRLIFDKSQKSLSLTATGRADASASGDIAWVPHGVVGTLFTCAAGSAPYSVSGSAVVDSSAIQATVTPAGSTNSGALGLDILFADVRLVGSMREPPIASLLIQNPGIQVTCSPAVSGTVDLLTLLGAISKYTPMDVAGALMSASGVDSATRRDIELVAEGKIDRAVSVPSIHIVVQPVAAKLGSSTYQLVPSWTNGAILLTAR